MGGVYLHLTHDSSKFSNHHKALAKNSLRIFRTGCLWFYTGKVTIQPFARLQGHRHCGERASVPFRAERSGCLYRDLRNATEGIPYRACGPRRYGAISCESRRVFLPSSMGHLIFRNCGAVACGMLGLFSPSTYRHSEAPGILAVLSEDLRRSARLRLRAFQYRVLLFQQRRAGWG